MRNMRFGIAVSRGHIDLSCQMTKRRPPSRHTSAVEAADRTCPLCERQIPPGAKASRHHLVPKLKGGARGETVLLHQICHSALHARFSEADLARRLNTVEALRSEPELHAFLAWVRGKPGDFHAPTRQTGARSGARRDAGRRFR